MLFETDLGGTPEGATQFASRLTREQVVDRIIQINPSADAGFLGRFDPPELEIYLTRLERMAEPRGRRATWVRRATSPAISTSRRRH